MCRASGVSPRHDVSVISTPTGDVPFMAVNVAGSIGVFGVLNTDGSVNSPTNPAETGSIVSLCVTGLAVPRPNPPVAGWFHFADGGSGV